MVYKFQFFFSYLHISSRLIIYENKISIYNYIVELQMYFKNVNSFKTPQILLSSVRFKNRITINITNLLTQ